MTDQETTTMQFGTNMWLVDEMYRDYLANPDSVGESWKEFFSDYKPTSGTGTSAGERTRPAGNGARSQPKGTASAAPEAKPKAEAKPKPDSDGGVPDDATPLRGVAGVIAENMVESLGVPTATSIRTVPAKLLEVNRKIINNQLKRTRGGKVSFTHLIGWAIVKAMEQLPAMTSIYHEAGGKAYVRRPAEVNLGLAMDIEKKDGSRTLLVPNIKDVHDLDFAGFFRAYEEVVRKVRKNELSPDLFAGTTATLTNPGTVGTIGSVPRLMPGQSVIIGVGAIDYPSEYQATDPRALAEIGVGKVITLTSTYDHRVIQGAESGMFLKAVHELLLGQHGFYDEIFDSLAIPYEPVHWHTDENPGLSNGGGRSEDKQVAVQRLIRQYRVRGHLIANLNPLSTSFQRVHPELDPATYGLTIWDLDREFATGNLAGRDRMTLGDILGLLRDAYCRTIGVEYMHIQEPDQKDWIQERVEGASYKTDVDEQRVILSRLNSAEAFEKFLHTKYLGHKRFSLEGAESTIAMLGSLLDAAADAGVEQAVMGMAHRGRLNVLANILHKSKNKIFNEFEGNIDPDSTQGSGDVKYHLGTKGTHEAPSGATIEVELASNPSHLEAVNPVVQGMARAKLDEMGATVDQLDRDTPVLPVLLHGDAAFAGQGVVAETLGASQLRGYRTGGTVHLVINNQVGFTTSVESARSSTYATDVAKFVQAPIFHVNGDDPEACARVMKLAFDFRQRFGTDVVVDLVCYRRHGHNEGDDPSYTQPIMYRAIEEHRSVRKLYTEELVVRGDLTLEEAEESMDSFREKRERSRKETRDSAPPQDTRASRPPQPQGVLPAVETGVDREVLARISTAVTSAPEGFTIHPKLAKQLDKRAQMLDEDRVDWAMGEAFAFGSLVLEGHPVRLAGQDSRRGTFSQRHSVLINYDTGEEHTPLAELSEDQARFMVYDSWLSEYAAMGFEYGYSVTRKDALTLWEAQFGDFVNGAQIIIDQFLVAAEDKWGQTSGLVLLLPHGFEGQGPEHSSARIERFLVLAAEDNIQVAQPTNAAQYFHLLRRQMHRDVRKPLIVFTPKGLLRAKPATSPADAFTSGSFSEVIRDDAAPDGVRRVLLASGRVAYDLLAHRDKVDAAAAVVRVEQLYPWPDEQILEAVRSYGDTVEEVVWVQDEPENMGPWPFAHQRLHKLLREDYALRHVSRFESASPATGSATIHEQELEDLLERTFDGL
jgi:multifunctional 2-oxoglutarate metabolism enzyme